MVGQLGTAMLSAGGSIEAGQAEKNTDYANAVNMRTAANSEETAAAANATTIGRQAARISGEAQAAAGASGVSGTTPLAVMHNIASEGELARQMTLYKGRNRARELMGQAAISSAEGQQAASAGLIQGGTTILSAFDKAAEQAALMAGGGGG